MINFYMHMVLFASLISCVQSPGASQSKDINVVQEASLEGRYLKIEQAGEYEVTVGLGLKDNLKKEGDLTCRLNFLLPTRYVVPGDVVSIDGEYFVDKISFVPDRSIAKVTFDNADEDRSYANFFINVEKPEGVTVKRNDIIKCLALFGASSFRHEPFRS